ncbi:S-layer homology domain-containing protein [Paenibacillus sp. 1_12]|uniref:S-layer homology domain-containing protein n=1 Tax=Paenibacillus sp. 1_12 TaxID=1566278 RepID=UPI0008E45275|nr:S-layer homology domain-containing protein [Paenibacillus sp. 1_12]SFM51398.1 S-layer homology domain-containing protein [Paenibacillus sp. 1_12]
MKKYVAILLTSILTFGIFPCWTAASPTVNWQAIYKEYIVQALTDKDGLTLGQDWEVVLIDLDMDGVPELIAGEAYREVSPVDFIKTIRDGQLVDLRQRVVGNSNPGSLNVNVGMNAFSVIKSSIKLYLVKNTGKYKYIGRDGFSGVDSWGDWEYEMNLAGMTLNTNEITRSQAPNSWKKDDGFTDQTEFYYTNDRKVSKKDYDLFREEYYADLIEVPHGAVSSSYMKLYNFDNGRINTTEIDTFLSSYMPTKAIKLNQIPADWAKDEIDQALALNLIPDDLQGGYANPITRSDFCRLIVQMLTTKTGKTVEVLLSGYGKALDPTAFNDTLDQAILTAQALGIVSGKGKGQFDPDGSIKRQEAAVMLSRAAKVIEIDINRSGVSFADYKQVAEWAKEPISFVSAAKDSITGLAIMSGTGNGKFSPLEYYSRQQAMITIKRLYYAN